MSMNRVVSIACILVLGQLLMPLIVLGTFLLKTRDTFGASVGLWWLGQSLMDIAPYINDARSLNLILLGGITGQECDTCHDWEYILRKLGLLQADHFLGQTSHYFGIALMLCALGWGGFLLFRQYRKLSL